MTNGKYKYSALVTSPWLLTSILLVRVETKPIEMPAEALRMMKNVCLGRKMITVSCPVMKVSWDSCEWRKMYVWDEKWSLSQAVSWRSVGTPVSDKKRMFGTKNDHFLKLCHEGQLGPPASKLSALCAKREVENTPKCTRLTVSLPHDPVRPCRP